MSALPVPGGGHWLVLGGVRSGKSAFAERVALRTGLAPVYVATAEAMDAEMARRIAAHRARRGANWRTVEEPLALPEVVRREARPDRVVLVECLTLWLTNLLTARRCPARGTAALVEALGGAGGPVVLVSNEVGQGVVPENALARRFVDEAGRMHQAVAAAVNDVVLVVAGLPLRLKRDGQPSGEAD